MPDNGVAWLEEELDRLKEAGLYNTIRTLESPMDAWVVIDGQRDRKSTRLNSSH